jgi:hypothetical protein
MMTRMARRCSIFALAALSAAALIAQQNTPANPPGGSDITGIPPARGIYYRTANGWVALSPTVLMPLWNGKHPALEVLNVGWDHADSQIPGSHSPVQIANDARPTFYLHGISPNDVFIVRAARKPGYRELRMPIHRDFWEWAQFRPEDLTDFSIVSVNEDVIAIRPSTDLKAGEYALAAPAGTDYQWLRFGFDFGIAGSR